MDKYIYNNTLSDITYNGANYPASSYTLIQDELQYKTSNNEDLLTDVVNGDVFISRDLSAYIIDITEQINFLKGFEEKRDDSGRLISRSAATIKGWHYQFVEVEILTSSKDDGAKSFNIDSSVNTEFDIKVYDGSGTELTTESSANSDAEKSVIIWSPDFDYEILGGKMHISSQATDDIRVHVMGGAVDLGVAYSKPFIPSMNLKYLVPGSEINTDGRASKFLPKTTTGVQVNTNKFQITLTYPKGIAYSFAMGFEIFKE